MKIYVAGAGGMLGEAVQKVFLTKHSLKCTDIDVNEDWLEYCDFRDFKQYKKSVEAFNPDLLIHLGAHTGLEYCEENPDDSFRTNTLSVEHAATLANAHGVPMVYISTAGIFDGQQLTYDDWAQPNPLGIYARSKYLGERIVEERVAKHYIFRAGWMMGGGPKKDKKFISKMMKQIKAGATDLRVVDDKLGTPTYTVDFAINMEAVINTEFYGLYNMVCGGETGRFEVAEELVSILNLKDKVFLSAVSSDYFAKEYFAARPPSERLVNYKLNLRNINLMRDWKVSLKEYIDDYYQGYLD